MSRRVDVRAGGITHIVELLGGGEVRVGGQVLRVEHDGPDHVVVTDASGARHVVALAGTGSSVWAFAAGRPWLLDVAAEGSRPRRAGADAADLSAPMPATVVAIPAPPGTSVAAGDPLVVLEAMKMELVVRAPRDGIVSAVHCQVGELVRPGTPLAELAA
jgi:3-methylcrotonyl-CoA carboxylase alpha subunit